ncbi:TnpV protein [Longibaculum muris]|uniref:Transposon-encoded protein TnpV n=1 Tax=Longibaculum muris TaxID=1796628 RepID=A0A4R3ZAV5_9FIRM|nr:TnpV protein [Longibaculum muris]KXU40734.1 hypothetical protein HMPREF3037_03244 [Candidatus Stoquefichus sp. KLE1796]MCR1886970.1 TnpV protein [Longibaculum muris]TCW03001.1 transposon-encoded protein TnpV [Longibaculum muris]
MKDIEYKEVNGYLFPNLKGPEDVKVNSYFARMKVKYLKENHQGHLVSLMANNELSTYLEQVEKEANEMYDRLVEEYKAKWNVTEELKMENQMKWVQLMNNIDNAVKEVIMNELICI